MQKQFGSLTQAFVRAGLKADIAAEIAYILANPSQEVLTGPQTVDTTPRGMRMVTPEDRKYVLRNLDFRDADPDHRKQRIPMTEDKPRPQPPSTVRETQAPQQTESKFNVDTGGFTEARSTGDSVQVGLRIRGPEQSVATIDSAGNSLVGKSIRAETDASGLRFFIESSGEELVWKLQSVGTGETGGIEVVTDVRLSSSGLEITKQRLVVFKSGDPTTDIIPVDSCE
jgi:hypothetical protein